MDELPIVFVAHGAPTLALDGKKGAALSEWARSFPRPDAILAVSAHWERTPVFTGAEDTRELIYDFHGFPAELYQLEYPAPGAPDLAGEVRALLSANGQRTDSAPDRGWDHGVWVPLSHMFPEADIPLLQLSLPSEAGPEAIFALGKAIAPLRRRGVLIMASGVLVHNLSTIDYREREATPQWALDFDDWLADSLVRGDHDALVGYERHAPDFHRSHPTPEHFTPLLVAAGAASVDGLRPGFPVTGFEYASLSRRCVQFG
ncbi:MAG TPA: class III extradiol ring-cleavage dioxygenase [Gammaproteobacteria bacterium]